MGRDLDAGHSALVTTMDLDGVKTAERLLGEAGAVNVAVKEVDAPLVTVLNELTRTATPLPEKL